MWVGQEVPGTQRWRIQARLTWKPVQKAISKAHGGLFNIACLAEFGRTLKLEQGRGGSRGNANANQIFPQGERG